MSLIDAYRHYRALKPDQLEMLSTKIIRGVRTPAEWLAFLGGIAAYDRTADTLRSATGWGIVIGFLLAFLSGVALHSTSIALLFLIVGLTSLAIFLRLKRDDIPNNMRECILPLTALLREEMEPDAHINFEVDLTGNTHAGKQTGHDEAPPSGRYISVKETTFRDPWFAGEATFADDSNVAWTVTDLVRERKVTKRGQSGKMKMKTKFKVKRVLDVRVALRADDYALADSHAAGGRGHDRVAVKEGDRRTVVKLRRIVSGSQPNAALDPRHIFDLLAGAYNRVKLNQTEG